MSSIGSIYASVLMIMQLSMLIPTTPLMGHIGDNTGGFLGLALDFCPKGGVLAHAWSQGDSKYSTNVQWRL